MTNTKVIAAAIFGAGAMIALAIYATRGGSIIPTFLDPYGKYKRAIEERVFDASSVEYRNWKKTGTGYCVEINAKNRLGAYVGFHKVLVTKYPDRMSVLDSGIAVDSICGKY